MLGFDGVTAMLDRVGPVTVSVVDPMTPAEVAWIVEEPAVRVVAVPGAGVVATAGVSDDQATEPVRFCVLPSLNDPVAVNCCVAFLANVGFAGVTAIDFNVAAATVSVMEPTTLPEVAVISVLPVNFAVTIPLPLIVATLGLWEFHTTVAEIS